MNKFEGLFKILYEDDDHGKKQLALLALQGIFLFIKHHI
jgi:hypothetical protein